MECEGRGFAGGRPQQDDVMGLVIKRLRDQVVASDSEKTTHPSARAAVHSADSEARMVRDWSDGTIPA